jgi:hypothetical protein
MNRSEKIVFFRSLVEKYEAGEEGGDSKNMGCSA